MTRFLPENRGGRFSRLTLLGSLFLIAANAAVSAQEWPVELLPQLKDRAVVLDIVARVLEQDQTVVWNQANSRVTIPGRPVGLKLVGDNVVVAVQFTPYRRQNGSIVLVAQGQIWVDVPNQGISYQTTMQTIPMEFGEPVYFFPLGSAKPGESRIEIRIELQPYTEASPELPQVEGPGETRVGRENTQPTGDGSVEASSNRSLGETATPK
ncbi:hypothetical protein AGMMS49991_06420 [Spirochaetia bacterium]|nr:hypothetical protein AGMMS49991_06420 [Spirochaetia bacterium]